MPWALGHDILVQRVGQHVERPHGPRVRFGRAGHRLQRAFEPAAQADQRGRAAVQRGRPEHPRPAGGAVRLTSSPA